MRDSRWPEGMQHLYERQATGGLECPQNWGLRSCCQTERAWCHFSGLGVLFQCNEIARGKIMKESSVPCKKIKCLQIKANVFLFSWQIFSFFMFLCRGYFVINDLDILPCYWNFIAGFVHFNQQCKAVYQHWQVHTKLLFQRPESLLEGCFFQFTLFLHPFCRDSGYGTQYRNESKTFLCIMFWKNAILVAQFLFKIREFLCIYSYLKTICSAVSS